MANFNILMPKLGESIQEGTITKWFVKEGDTIEEDDMLFEVATDKVDSEIPSPVDGVITKILFPEDSLVPVGEILAVIELEGEEEEISEAELEEVIQEIHCRHPNPRLRQVNRQLILCLLVCQSLLIGGIYQGGTVIEL